MAKFTTEYIFDTATSDAGMTKNDKVMFHLHNPNGLVNQLPEYEDFIHGNTHFAGCEMVYGQFHNYHAEWLRKVAHKPYKYTNWDLHYHLTNLKNDAVRAREVLAEKKAAA